MVVVALVKRVNPLVIKDGKLSTDERKALYLFGEGGFTVVSHALLLALADGSLSGEATRVLAHLMCNAKRGNRIELTQVKVAAALGMKRPNVSRAWRELREGGFIIRVTEPGGLSFWYVDARRSFRGSASSHPRSLEKQAAQRKRDARSNVVAIA